MQDENTTAIAKLENQPKRRGYNKTKLGLIPLDWEIVKLGELYDFKNGLNKEKEFFGYGTPIVNYMDVFNYTSLNKENVTGKVFLNENEINRFNIKKGDVFFTRTSETVNDIAYSSVLTEHIENGVFSGFVLRARPNEDNNIDLGFAQYCFSTHLARKEIISKSSFTTRALTNGRFLSEVNLLLPPLPEQQKIAKILSTWDRAIHTQEQLIAAKERFKKGLMQVLLTGKKRFKGFDGEWENIEFELIAERSKEKNSNVRDESLKCIELEHIIQNSGKINGFTDSLLQKSLKNRFNGGDILFGKLRPYLRKYWLAEFDGVCSSEIWVLRGKKDKCTNKFLFYLIQQNKFIQIANATTGSKMPRADWKFLKDFPFLIPSVSEQLKIISVLSTIDSELELLKQHLQELNKLKKGLMQRLLTGSIRVQP